MEILKKCDCTLCSFENPKPSATAIIMRNDKILVLKRNEEPFKGEWDFMGGYLHKGETPAQALRREIKEELGVDSRLTEFIGAFPGTASYKEYTFPILSFVYLAELQGKIVLDQEENSAFAWVSIDELNTIAFDSNQDILKYIKKEWAYGRNIISPGSIL